MRKLQNLVVGFLSLTLAGSAYADVELVKDGKAVADIVVPEKPLSSVKLAAEDLQTHLELMSGAKLEIVTAPSEKVKSHVYVGESELIKKLGVSTDDLKLEGFKIIARDNYIVLVGRDEQRQPFPYRWYGEGLKKWQEFAGEKLAVPVATPFNDKLGIFPADATATLYATSELLEQLGVRWYNPYENGTIIPERKTIAVPEQNLKKEPKFPSRLVNYAWGMATDVEGVLWLKHLKYGSSFLFGGGHGAGNIICTAEQKVEHPEYFAMVNGKRLGKTIGVPRLCSPEFRKATVNYLNKTFEAYPLLANTDVMPTDGFCEIDERDAKIWNRPDGGADGQMSDYVWDYWLFAAKELKKSHPDKYLMCISYRPYAAPASYLEKLPDNVSMCLVQNTDILFLPQSKSTLLLRKKWLSLLTSKKMTLYDYVWFYATEQDPRYPHFFTKFQQEDMRSLVGVCEGKNTETAATKGKIACPGLTHMLHYWQGKLYWDSDMDREKMLAEYYDLYFGSAKAEMKEFYEFAEEVWMRPLSRSVSSAGLGFLKEQDVDRYFDILKRAREKAGKDTVYDKRIVQIENEMQPLKKLFPNMRRSGPNVQAHVATEPVKLDGDLGKPFWTGQKYWQWYTMVDLATGQEPDKNRTSVSFRMTPDKDALLIGVVCDESKMDSIQAKTMADDDANIFNDDAVEIYIETPEFSFFKIVVNSEGKIFDESYDSTIVTRDTLPELWNPGVKAAVKKYPNRWTLELLIPTKDFGKLGPTKAYPWGIEVGRSRYAGSNPEFWAIAPTNGGPYATQSRWGNLWMQ